VVGAVECRGIRSNKQVRMDIIGIQGSEERRHKKIQYRMPVGNKKADFSKEVGLHKANDNYLPVPVGVAGALVGTGLLSLQPMVQRLTTSRAITMIFFMDVVPSNEGTLKNVLSEHHSRQES